MGWCVCMEGLWYTFVTNPALCCNIIILIIIMIMTDMIINIIIILFNISGPITLTPHFCHIYVGRWRMLLLNKSQMRKSSSNPCESKVEGKEFYPSWIFMMSKREHIHNMVIVVPPMCCLNLLFVRSSQSGTKTTCFRAWMNWGAAQRPSERYKDTDVFGFL